jgi:hypothetical protein
VVHTFDGLEGGDLASAAAIKKAQTLKALVSGCESIEDVVGMLGLIGVELSEGA